MAETVTCPEIKDLLSENDCLENFGGLGVNLYVFIKSDLAAPLSPEAGKNTYAALTTASFKSGKGLYKFECQDGGQGHTWENLGFKKGFKQTLGYVLESVNANTAFVGRGINNLKCGYIIEDGDKSIIVYDKQHDFKYDSGNIKGDTGKKPEDERTVTLSGSLSPTMYGRYEIAAPEGGWDSLLNGAGTSGGSVSGTEKSDTNSASRQSSKRSKQVASVNDETSTPGENDE